MSDAPHEIYFWPLPLAKDYLRRLSIPATYFAISNPSGTIEQEKIIHRAFRMQCGLPPDAEEFPAPKREFDWFDEKWQPPRNA